MSKDKVTEWLDEGTKPVRKGVYQRHYLGFCGESLVMYCYFDGAEWSVPRRTRYFARAADGRSQYQNLPWRGLADEPK